MDLLNSLNSDLQRLVAGENGNKYDNLFQTLTPASDIAFGGFAEYQAVFARQGNDVVYGFNHAWNKSDPVPINIDILLGDSQPVPAWLVGDLFNILGGNPPSGGKDRFVLGDWNSAYYTSSGYDDYAFIFDFSQQQDVIQLHGKAEDYQLIGIPFVGTGIFKNSDQSPFFWDGDLVGVVFWNFNLDLQGSNFRYVGNSPPTEIAENNIKQFGTFGIDIGTAVTTDLEGNVLVAGLTNGDAGAYDFWIDKYDSNGNQLWNQQFGSPQSENLFDIVTDKSGNFYVTGGTQGDLIEGLQSPQPDAWVAKYDSSGNQLWMRQFGSAILNGGSGLDIDENGNVYVSGITLLPDNRPEAVIPVQDDSWVIKYDPNGNQEWIRPIASPENSPALWDENYGVAVSNDGSIYSSGWTYGDFTGAGQFRWYDAWISKTKSNGELEWIQQFGTDDYEFSWDVDTDSQGNAYAYGWTNSNLGGENLGQNDIWLIKYQPDGTQSWSKQFGSNGDDAAFLGGLKIDSEDGIFLVGHTDGNLGGNNAGSYDAWVAHYDTEGNQIWIKQFGTSDLDYATDVTVDNAGHLYVVGFTEGSLGNINAGAVDNWVAKLDTETGTLEQFNGNLANSELNNYPLENSQLDNNLISSNSIFTDNDDTLTLTVDDDFANALAGNDLVTALAGNDTVYGSLGDDTILAGDGLDVINGNQGNDLINGNQGDDFLHGGKDNDSLQGGQGNDRLFGDLGNDSLIGGLGNDSLTGGEGSDRFILSSNFDTDTIIDFQNGEDLLVLNGNLNFAALSIIQDANQVLITVTNSNEVLATMGGISASTIGEEDFI